MRQKRTVILALVAALAVGGCKRAATGQVVAVVNGQEISLSELNAELGAAGQGAANDKQRRAQVLQSLIDRKLLVQEAKKRGIDKTPEYLQDSSRMEDQLLITLLSKQITRTLSVPSASDADTYINAHPEQFAQRTLYALDQVAFALPPDSSKLLAMRDDHDMTAVTNRLKSLGIKYVRRGAQMDSLATPPELLKRVLALPNGEPFVITGPAQVLVSVITGKQVTPLIGDQARAAAVEILRRKAIDDAGQRSVKDARTAAKIDYQPGFAPAK